MSEKLGDARFVRLTPDEVESIKEIMADMSDKLSVRITLSDIIRAAVLEYIKKYRGI